MIAEIGHFALILACLTAVVQGFFPLVGAARGETSWMALARPAAQVQFALVAIAFAALTYGYVVSDFSILNVAQNSHSAKPLLYKITGVWANHEGSMLLWVLILALFGAALASFGGNLPPSLRARALAVQGLIGVAFLTFILFTSNPFERVSPAPFDGSGLNPLLQDPGLAFHPPFLYLGYVGFSVAFSFAIAALLEGRVDPAWARWVRPWTLAAWSFLTLGIALGSWWAYYELGWGGWWFWDPVENASFMPWLAGTALLHSAIVVEKRDALKSWTVLLAIITFSLSLIGAFLVRSGVLTSVHSFATDPQRGMFILAILVVAIGGSLALYAWRAPALRATGGFKPVSREGAIVFNNLLLTTATATVFLGTLYPLVLDAVGGGKISVGAPYFNATFVPIMTPLIIAMALGPVLSWKRSDLWRAFGRLKLALAAALGVVALSLWLDNARDILAAFGMGLAAWLFVGTAAELAGRIKLGRVGPGESLRRAFGVPRAAYGMSIAHMGMAVAIAGITASSAWQSEVIRHMAPGQSASLAGYSVRFDGVSKRRGANYTAQLGTFSVTRGARHVATLVAEKRFYPVQRRNTTEAAIHTTWLSDIYAVLGDANAKGGFAVRLYHNPLVPWIWLGAIVMFVGGAVSLSDRRHRIGAPRRSAERGRRPLPARA
ncbi:MAG: heme lyase CcmF/NrfE family subunit [Alphaproteobacteria bacterium]